MNSACAIVVTYNRLNLLKECIENLFAIDNYLTKIIIVNNNSTDGTKEYLTKLQNKNESKILVVNLEENLGGAKGFEIGMEAFVEKTDCEFAWIMDDDTMVRKNTLAELIDAAKKTPDFGFLCSNVRWTDGSSMNVPPTSPNWSNSISEGLIKVDSATFVSILFSRSKVINLGFPIGNLFIWGDDTEYTTRFALNYPSYFVINSIVDHKSQVSANKENIINADVSRLDRYFYSYRNQLFIIKKYQRLHKYFIKILKNLIMIFEILIKSDRYRFKRISTVIKGTFAGILFFPKVPKYSRLEKK